MSNSSSNNKRLAKNTLFLYIRMLFLMAVNLYTSRVILKELGVEDYGIYNAVAGFIAMFSMVSSAMSSSISRFITFVLGQGDNEKLNKVFSTSVIIQLVLAIVIVILVEIFGVWFLNTHMTIPEERLVAANWVLQLSLVTFVLNLWSVPYNAALIAHEKMDAFAYIGIFEGIAGLSVAYLIKISPIDNLVFYATLMMGIAFIVRMIYTVYCKRNLAECSFKWIFDKILVKEMFGFAGWNFIGTISGLLRNQGINILFNVYNGPVVNAARGLAVQVDTAILKFSQSFYTAVQPQITKSYAASEIDESHSLVIRSSRLAFFLLMVLGLPVITEAEFLLSLWLGEVPSHTVAFVQIVVVLSLFESFSQPLIHLMLATGDIKKYQIIVGSINLLNFPVAWLLLHIGYSPEIAQLSVAFFAIASIAARLIMLKGMTNFPVRQFINGTLVKCISIFIICLGISCSIANLMEFGYLRFVCNLLITEFASIVFILCIGLTRGERTFIMNKIRSVIK